MVRAATIPAKGPGKPVNALVKRHGAERAFDRRRRTPLTSARGLARIAGASANPISFLVRSLRRRAAFQFVPVDEFEATFRDLKPRFSLSVGAYCSRRRELVCETLYDRTFRRLARTVSSPALPVVFLLPLRCGGAGLGQTLDRHGPWHRGAPFSRVVAYLGVPLSSSLTQNLIHHRPRAVPGFLPPLRCRTGLLGNGRGETRPARHLDACRIAAPCRRAAWATNTVYPHIIRDINE